METKLYTVFVASPSELTPEREALEQVINELNNTWITTIGVSLHLVKWETHTYPGFDQDAQAVINDETPDTYDIFIGILWTRFGSPTHRSESGTLEEFERAYSQYKRDPKSINIMLYFKDQAKPPSQIDTKQLEKVKDFQKKVTELGGFSWIFQDTQEFIKLMRTHLSKHILEEYSTTKNSLVSVNPIIKRSDVTPDIIKQNFSLTNDEGFFEMVEKGVFNFEKLADSIKDHTQNIRNFTQKVIKRTNEISTLGPPKDQVTMFHMKQIVNGMANDMDIFSSQTNEEAILFKETYSNGIDAIGKAAVLSKDFGDQSKTEITKLLNTIQISKVALINFNKSMQAFRNQISALPRVTAVFMLSKLKCLQILDKFITYIDSGLNLTNEIEILLLGLIK